jgi:hypothetical protein
MRRLSSEQFRRARHFLKTEARHLDRALFEHRFEKAPAERVIIGLGRYHNDDGGFGHALEPDVRVPSSSALATGIALSVLKELGCSSDHPMVTGAIQFLRETFDEQTGVWRVLPPDANDYPHAPWWHNGGGSLARTFDNFLIIPRAQLVGLLHHYSVLVPADWLDTVTEDAVTAIETLEDDVFGGGGDTLRYALDLAEAEGLPRRFEDRVAPRLRDLVVRAVCRDPQEWSGYCTTPLKVAPVPQSLVADALWDDLQTHLDYVIDQQTPDGTWEPTWTWGDFYSDVWKAAKHEWRGYLTLETLTSLHAFERIDL